MRFRILPLALLMLSVCMLAGTTPSGRPPAGPLERKDPKLYDFAIQVTLLTDTPYDALQKQAFNLADTPIMMPVIFQGTYNRIEPDSLNGTLWLDNVEDKSMLANSRIDDDLPHHQHAAIIPIAKFQGQSLRWELSYRVQTWSSNVTSEQAMANIAWPREWPEEVKDGLTPQMFIESDNEIFAQTIERISNGQLRFVPPYYAAKDIVRYCVNELQVSGDGLARGERNSSGEVQPSSLGVSVLQGMEVKGAALTAQSGTGSPHDLLCVCIAMLRAAQIPARPVIGIEKNEHDRNVFVSWGEFYLPEVGWIPFDPNVMRGKGIRNKKVQQPWPEFGTMKDLNERIPLSYHFIPPKTVETPGFPAVWGWDPRPNGAPSSTIQAISFTTAKRAIRNTGER
jgi:hypothetical protein